MVFSRIASAPMAVLKSAVVLFLSAAAPIPVRCLPVVFKKSTRKPMARLKLALLFLSASAPMAMLNWPVVFSPSAKAPTATLLKPLVSFASALEPTATLLIPTAGLTTPSALTPTAVFAPAPQSVGQSAALSGGESANQQSAIATVKKPQRNGERLLDLIRVFIFCLFICWNLPC